MGIALDEIRETEEKRIDYVGFTFDGIHSSQLKILSVSNGSRYTWNLLPTIEDYNIDIVGGYGSNYFGGKFKTREIKVDIAFDEVEEIHLRALRELFADREVHTLYFDEEPYKVYHAVISKVPQIKFIAFGDVGTRVYKGEGSITFTCYDPIAYSLNGNYLENYDWENINEWAAASGMLDNKQKYIKETNTINKNYYDTPSYKNGICTIHAYNAGNIATPFNLKGSWTSQYLDIQLKQGSIKKYLKLKKDIGTNDTIYIDTSRSVALELFGTGSNYETYSEFNSEGNQVVLNTLVIDGRFFMLPPGESELTITGAQNIYFQFYHRYI